MSLPPAALLTDTTNESIRSGGGQVLRLAPAAGREKQANSGLPRVSANTRNGNYNTRHAGRPCLLLVPLRVGAPSAAGAEPRGQELEQTLPEGGAAGGVEDEVDAEVRVLQLHEELLQVPHGDLVRLLLAAPQTAEEGVHPDYVAVGEEEGGYRTAPGTTLLTLSVPCTPRCPDSTVVNRRGSGRIILTQ